MGRGLHTVFGAPPCAAPKAWCARCSGRLVWAHPAAATPAGAGGWGRLGARCAGPAASAPPPRRGPFWGREGVPSAPGGRRAAPVAPKLGGGAGGGGLGGPPPRPVRRRPAICCLQRAPPGYTRAVGVAGRPRASGAVRSAANGSVRRVGGGGPPPPWFAPPSALGRPLMGPLRVRRPGRRQSAASRQRVGRAGACLGRGASAPRVQRPLRGGCGAAVSSVCLRPLLGLSGRGGGSGGGPPVPWRRLLTAEGGAAWRSRPRGPAIGWEVAPFPRPPLLGAGPSCRPSLGPLVPPAVVARRWPAGGGREG